MEKTILQLMIALFVTAMTSIDMLTSFGVITLMYSCIESIQWLIKRIYLNKEKDPSQSAEDFD